MPYAETMLVAWSRAKQDVAIKPDQKFQLNIGTTSGLWQFALQEKLTEVHRHFPELAIRAEARTSDDLLRLVLDRILDVVVSYDSSTQPELSSKPVGKLKLVLASTLPGVSPRNAFQSNYVYVDWGIAFDMFHAKRFADAPPAMLHTNMASIAESFINQNGGTAYLPEKLLQHSSNRALQQVDGAPSFSRDVYVVYRSNSTHVDLIEALIPHLTV